MLSNPFPLIRRLLVLLPLLLSTVPLVAQPAGVPVLALDSSGRIMVDAEHIVYHVERQYETLLEVINQPASQWQPIERKAVTIGQIGEPV